jgi:hypothetical protein
MSGKRRVSQQCAFGLALLAAATAQIVRAIGQEQAGGESPVVMLTSQQDHDRQMQLLKISGFPPGPDACQAAANYFGTQ